MAIVPDDALPTDDGASLLKWVDEQEKEIDLRLRERQYRFSWTEDYYLVPVSTPLRAGNTQDDQQLFRRAAHEISVRYRMAGWDEAVVDPASGVLSLKRFRRRVMVAVRDLPGEISAPVDEGESPDAAARRIVAEGFTYGTHDDVHGPGVHFVGPGRVENVRIPMQIQATDTDG